MSFIIRYQKSLSKNDAVNTVHHAVNDAALR